MASTFSPNLNLELQGTGDNIGTWGVVLNNAALDIIDNAMGDTQTLTLSSVNVTVTTTQSQVAVYVLSGTLTNNVIIDWPAIGRVYVINNATTGDFTVTLRRNGTGTTLVAPQGRVILVYLRTTGVFQLTDAGAPVGMVTAFAQATVPSGGGWLECNGAAVSRTTYSILFDLLGTTYGPGNGTTTFNLPDLRGYFVRGWNHGAGANPDTGRAIATVQTSSNLSHTHTGTTTSNGAHTHQITTGVTGSGTNSIILRSPVTSVSTGVNATESGGTHNHTFTTAASGGTEARPSNVAMMYCIRVL